jgi:hypothetical protein
MWLTIAGFYRRAEMLDEGRAAVLEAQKLLEGIESEAAKDESNTGAMSGVGWGERKSIDDVWGDVWSEVRVCANFACSLFSHDKCANQEPSMAC